MSVSRKDQCTPSLVIKTKLTLTQKNCHQANPHVHQQHLVWATTFQSGLPLAGATQTETSLLVNVWICLMILISQQEPWLKQKNCLHSVRLHSSSSLCSYITPVSKNIFSIRYARCKIKTVVCTPYPQVTAGTQKNWKDHEVIRKPTCHSSFNMTSHGLHRRHCSVSLSFVEHSQHHMHPENHPLNL